MSERPGGAVTVSPGRSLSRPADCILCDGPCKEPMRFTHVLGRDRMHDLTEHEDDAVIDPNLAPIGRRGRR